MEERGLRNRDLARSLKTYETKVSRWRSGAVPRETTRKEIVRALNRVEGFDPITEADLGWETEMAA